MFAVIYIYCGWIICWKHNVARDQKCKNTVYRHYLCGPTRMTHQVENVTSFFADCRTYGGLRNTQFWSIAINLPGKACWGLSNQQMFCTSSLDQHINSYLLCFPTSDLHKTVHVYGYNWFIQCLCTIPKINSVPVQSHTVICAAGSATAKISICNVLIL